MRSCIVVALVIGIGGAVLHAEPTLIDLTELGSSATISGAIWEPVDPHSAGTGVFEPFVRIQGNGIEEGYNTDGTPEFQTKNGTWTHSLTLSDLIATGEYYEFTFNADQNKTEDGRLLSIDKLIISLEPSGDLDAYPGEFSGPIVYDLDRDGDVSVLMDYDLSGEGIGSGDLLLRIPITAFETDGSNQYIYLYTMMGAYTPVGAAESLYPANDGPEEWRYLAGTGETPTIPAPGAVLLAGIGIGLVGWIRQKKVL